MTEYTITTVDPNAQFHFSSFSKGIFYRVDDKTGYVTDDNGIKVKISHLQAHPLMYLVKPWAYLKVTAPESSKVISDGSASSYYDFPKGSITLNDLLEYKGDKQWLGDSFHLSNIFKAAWRWGEKDGVDIPYDCRKIIYSGCRLLMKHAGVASVRKTLQGLLDDPQFQERN